MHNAHTPSMWHQEFTFSKKPNSSPSPFWTRSKPPPTSPGRKDGKTNDYNRVFAFFLGPEKHKEQGLWQAPLFGCPASEETAPAGEMKVGGVGQGGQENGGSVGVGGGEVGALCVWGVKRATEMAGDEDGPALAAITHVAWSYGPISTKTNYRRGNFTDRKNLSPSGTLPLRDFTQPLWAALRRENPLRGRRPTTPAPWWMGRRRCGSEVRGELFCFYFFMLSEAYSQDLLLFLYLAAAVIYCSAATERISIWEKKKKWIVWQNK